jgi:inosine-uridine nucleoside N-ribohydrolase
MLTYADVRSTSQASYAVVHSGLEIVVIGLEVANADVCPPEALEKLVSAQMSKKSGVSTPAWLLRALMLSFDMSVSYAAVAAFYRVHPECFMLERAWVQVDAHSGKLTGAFTLHPTP